MPTLPLQQAIEQALRHHQAGDLQQAEQIYRAILQKQPNQPDALHLLGVIAQQVGRSDAAVELIGKAIAAGLRSGAVYNNLGEAYRTLNQNDRAADWYRKAIELEPEFAGAHSNLGIVLAAAGDLDKAEEEYQIAIKLDPSAPEPYTNLGNLLVDKGQLEPAVEYHRRAIELRPSYAEAHHNLGAALEKLNQLDEAEKEYRLGAELRPGFAEAFNNIGAILQKQGKFDEALLWWQRTVQVQNAFADAHWNIALTQLARGMYQPGFQGYEWRWRCKHSAHYWREYPGKPRWDGSSLAGKTILLFPEQGFGDVIQFARFIPEVAAKGARVILECQQELVEVMKTVPGVSQVIAARENPPAFDVYLALLSLPSVLGTTAENLPRNVPYLRADPSRAAAWADRIVARGTRKVGLVWGGKKTPDPKRSIPLRQLSPLWDVPNIAWFSLQTGEPSSQLSDAPTGLIRDLGKDFTDFADTAAAIAQLDLIITIDTATAHLAGAMGAKTWTMIPFAPDWRWMHNRNDSPWYPTMRLFRQPKIDQWEPVVGQVREELLRR